MTPYIPYISPTQCMHSPFLVSSKNLSTTLNQHHHTSNKIATPPIVTILQYM